MNNLGKIYIIKNNINDKVYIGQTITSLSTRWNNHLANARNIEKEDNKTMIIYNAMRKHGIDNFYIELLEDNIPKDKLKEREDYWILFYNSIRPNGYNILLGSENPKPFKGKPIYQLNKDTFEIIEKFESIGEASQKLNIPFEYISRVVRGAQLSTKGYRWCYQEDYEDYLNNPPITTSSKNYYNKKYDNNKQQPTKVILQINIQNGEIIKEWYNGVVEAAKSINRTPSGIYDVLHERRKTCGGYVWKYK